MTRAEWRRHVIDIHGMRRTRVAFAELLAVHEREHAVGDADHTHPEGARR